MLKVKPSRARSSRHTVYKEGAIVVVRFSGDGQWYEARITKTYADECKFDYYYLYPNDSYRGETGTMKFSLLNEEWMFWEDFDS